MVGKRFKVGDGRAMDGLENAEETRAGYETSGRKKLRKTSERRKNRSKKRVDVGFDIDARPGNVE